MTAPRWHPAPNGSGRTFLYADWLGHRLSVPAFRRSSGGGLHRFACSDAGRVSPGTYLLICNVPGHYAAGMVSMLNVTP